MQTRRTTLAGAVAAARMGPSATGVQAQATATRFKAIVASGYGRWGTVIRSANIRVE